jgi:hypothetical protein
MHLPAVSQGLVSGDRRSIRVAYRCPIAPEPPPLLSSLPTPTRLTIVVLVPLLFGAVCGFLASESAAGWWIANVISTPSPIAIFPLIAAIGGLLLGALGGRLRGRLETGG